MQNEVSCNNEQQVFVIPCSGGFSCLGYDNCFKSLKQLAEMLGEPDYLPKEEERGTLGQYQAYQSLLSIAGKRPAKLGTWYTPGTDPRVKRVLESLIDKPYRVRVFYGDGETGRDWLEEFDTIGRIGRSTGTLRVPLLCSKEGDGSAILTNKVIRIVNITKRQELYRHPQYHLPELLQNFEPGCTFPWVVKAANAAGTEFSTIARFKAESQRRKWAGFMSGEAHRSMSS